MPVLLWTLLIFHFSSQSFQEQSIQLILHKWFTKEGMLSVVPDVTVHYDHSAIEAKKQPFEFTEFVFRKTSHLFMYAVLAGCAFSALAPYRWRIRLRVGSAIGYVVAVASTDEWNQARSVQRTSAIQDVVLDFIGGVIGLAVLIFCLIAFYKAGQSNILRRGEV